ncbi:MAG TPA: carbohydrate ABC transporter permease [Limnochordia bacterium]|nr:carbohydrate ABC transporter permease [Limnochordia bacterium]
MRAASSPGPGTRPAVKAPPARSARSAGTARSKGTLRVLRAARALAIHLLLGLIAALVLLPFIMMLLGTFREHVDIIRRGPLALPTSLGFANYRTVLFDHRFLRYYANSFWLTAPPVALSLVFAIMSAFAFSVMQFPGKNLLLLGVVGLGVMVASEFIMIPLFQLVNALGLVNTFTGVNMPNLAMSACFSTLVIRSFFMGLPRELLDSALVDGASSWQALWQVYVPIARPAIVTCGALTTVWTWNTYIIPLVLLHDPAKAPLPLALALFQGQYVANVPLIMTGATLTALPMILVYLVFQPRIAWGLTQGAIK